MNTLKRFLPALFCILSLGAERGFAAGMLIPKPDPAGYAAMIAKHAVTPAKAVMFEDSHKNLGPAAALGMKTVWVRHAGEMPTDGDDLSHCHYQTDDLLGWLSEMLAEPQS